jgi:hypothetical protein
LIARICRPAGALGSLAPGFYKDSAPTALGGAGGSRPVCWKQCQYDAAGGYRGFFQGFSPRTVGFRRDKTSAHPPPAKRSRSIPPQVLRRRGGGERAERKRIPRTSQRFCEKIK